MAPHLDLNVIVVGENRFTPAKATQANDSLAAMTGIFAARGPVIGVAATEVATDRLTPDEA